MMKRLSLILSIILTLVLVTACGGTSEKTSKSESGGGAKKGGNLTFGLAGEPATMDPQIQNGTHGRTIKLAIYRGLLNYNKDGKLENELAKDYTVSEDQKTYTFNLRDAKFQNGDAVTAEDVKYTFERIIKPDSKATFKTELSIIQSIEVKDEKTISFTLKEPSAPFVHYLALPESVIVSKKWVEEKGENADPMGAGPFKFVSWTKGQDLVVEKFKNYYKPDQPKLDSIKFVFYPDENTRVNALRAGDVDLIETVPWKDADSLAKTPGIKLDSVNGPFMQLQFNTKFKPFNDPKVRQAIAYAIDRKSIINTAFSGRGEAIYGMAIPKGYMGYSDKVNKYFKHDVEKAKQLLAEAGYPKGFKARLLSTSQFSFHQQTAVAVQAELKKIGIEVELDLPDWATRINKNTEGDYDFVVAGTAGDITDADWLSNFYNGGDVRLNNSAYFNDPEINQLLIDGRKESDPAKREANYQKLIDRAMELSPFVYLSWREQSYGMKSNVEGFKNLEGFLSFQSGVTLENVYLK
ncbi:ABC transporter substrate-binding protein [Neobacillus drentensis]|uniref:ABC transporter substrate-binding protein n=1 Tax=Neobacillus drentensis TaxID=220684 RepID=UPI0030010841